MSNGDSDAPSWFDLLADTVFSVATDNKKVRDHPNPGHVHAPAAPTPHATTVHLSRATLVLAFESFISGAPNIPFFTAEARQSALNQILHPEAADRLGRIRMVKESRAVEIENRLIMLAQSGQLRSKVTEEQLKDLLNAVAENSQKQEEKIVVSRRKAWEDEDDDLLDL